MGPNAIPCTPDSAYLSSVILVSFSSPTHALIHKLALHPALPLDTQLNRRKAPVQTMIMTLVLGLARNARSVQSLFVVQERQEAKDDGHIAVQL